jgi:hypothetical protein
MRSTRDFTRALATLAVAVATTAAQAPRVGLVDEPVAPLLPSSTPVNNPLFIEGPLSDCYGLANVSGDGAAEFLTSTPPFLYLNDGHGRLTPSASASLATPNASVSFALPLGAAVADLNGDGYADVALMTPPGVVVYLSDGVGGFLAPIAHAGVGGYLAAGDFDGDSDVDLISMTGASAGPTRLLLNDGAGNFTEATGAGLPASSGASVVALDVDGDGDLDVALGLSTGFVLALNDGTGVFTATPPISIPAVFVGRLRAANFGGDATEDLVVSHAPIVGSTTYSGYAGSANGIPSLAFTAPPAPSAIRGDLRVGNLDADPETEFVIASEYGVFVVDLVAGQPVETRLSDDAAVSAFVGDLDGDGDLDILVEARHPSRQATGRPHRFLRKYFNDGAGVFHADGPSLPSKRVLSDPIVGDFDGDGSPDLLGPVSDETFVSRFTAAANDGFGRFSWVSFLCPTCPTGDWKPSPCAECVYLPPSFSSIPAAAALDYDGDGMLDFAVAVRTAGVPHEIVIVRNLGGWSFAVAETIPMTGALTDLAAVDVDLDGDMDLVSGESGAFGLRLHLNVGGVFGAPISLGVPAIADVEVADVDLDGDPDLVLAGSPSRLLLNDGVGGFVVDATFPALNGFTISVANVDATPTPEVFIGDQVYSFHAATGWTFAFAAPMYEPWLPPLYAYPKFAAADVDENGSVELVSDLGYYSEVGGSIGTRFVTASAGLVASVDLDRDGGKDFLVSGWTLLHNTARRMELRGAVRPGRPMQTELFGAPNGAYMLFCSLPPIGGPIPAAPYGSILADLGSLVLLDSGALDANGKGISTLSIPTSAAALIGTEYVLQAVVDAPAGPRLTNARKAKIEGY